MGAHRGGGEAFCSHVLITFEIGEVHNRGQKRAKTIRGLVAHGSLAMTSALENVVAESVHLVTAEAEELASAGPVLETEFALEHRLEVFIFMAGVRRETAHVEKGVGHLVVQQVHKLGM